MTRGPLLLFGGHRSRCEAERDHCGGDYGARRGREDGKIIANNDEHP
jgi:hypothetical protein